MSGKRSNCKSLNQSVFLAIVYIMLSSALCYAGVFPENSTIIKDFDTDPSILNVFSTPIAFFDNAIYTVRVETPSATPNKINLVTKISKGIRTSNGQWQWSSTVIENRTLNDMYHTQPSLQIDKKGYIHVAYNMHNMPWQYSVSKKPEDISEFVFKGEHLDENTLRKVKYENKTPFPNLGSAAIPGTQITYPAFFKDRNGDIYISYRFATKPKRPWKERGFAGGLAKYNTDTGKWTSIGRTMFLTHDDADVNPGQDLVTHPFAFFDTWSVYGIRLFFDKDNAMHCVWEWREGGAGPDCSLPSYAFSPDGINFFKADKKTKYTLPISKNTVDTCASDISINKIYSPVTFAVDAAKQPVLFISQYGDASRIIVGYNNTTQKWKKIGPTPWSATNVFIDDDGNEWAFATGLIVFRKEKNSGKWQMIFKDTGFGYPKISVVPSEKGFLVQTYSIDGAKTRIYWIKDNKLNFNVKSSYYTVKNSESTFISPPKNVKILEVETSS